MKISISLILLTWWFSVTAADSIQVSSTFVFNAIATKEKIKIDGILDESIWKDIAPAEFSQEHWPQNGRAPMNKTEAMITRDDQFLYVAFKCHDINEKYIIQTLKRDFEFDQNDFISVMLDPNGQKNTAYIFGVSPAGVQAEALVNRFDVDPNWDNKWYSAVKTHPDHWIAEIAIPLFILRYEPTLTSWNLNFLRGDVKNYRFYTWVKIPQQYDGIDLGFLGQLNWQDGLPKNGGKVTAIPYINTSTAKDFEDATNTKNKFGFGGDAKITLSSNLNLDMTINPDFSQVEVDRQVTNLTRFNVFFPERRNFFLENADLFSQFGDPESPIFFSRRIGLDNDARAVPIIGGARLTGNLGETWRLGIMSMQTKTTSGQAGQNYSAFTLHKKLWKRSLIKGLITNRQAMDGKSEFSKTDYGRNASLEFVYQRPDGKILSWLGLHDSYKQNIKNDKHHASTGIWYNGTNFSTLFSINTIGTNYTADMGFINQLDNYDAVRDTVIKQGFHGAFNSTRYILRTPKNKFINYHELSTRTNLKQIPNSFISELTTGIYYELSLKSSAELSSGWTYNHTRLLYPFTFTDDVPLPPGKYNYSNFSMEFQSDVRKPFGYEIEGRTGGFYNGTISSLEVGFRYRRQPWGNFQMNFEYNRITFPEPYGKAEFLLVNPKLEFNFNRNLYWTTFLQYNTQADNFNINSRLQWRYKPMSDIFLVYTDNHAVEFWGPKNRTLVLKVNYWLNL